MDFRQVGKDWVLFDPSTRRIHVLDVTGALVWSYCSGEMDVPAMEAEIRRAFGVALPAGQNTGVRAVLRDLMASGLLRDAL